ncbi:MAG: putative CXXCH cytochrome family protein [Salibacteraceae bacterium]|jgi:predicted CXXCH cytochrome family protein
MPKFLVFFFSIIILVSCDENGKKEVYQPEKKAGFEEPYLGASKCKECHESEFAEWKQSDHFFAMQKATPEYVKANFDTSYSADQIEYQFSKTDSHYLVQITEAGVSQNFNVAYTFGWHPLQQYLLEAKSGKFQTLRASWDTEKNRWFHQNSGTIVEPHDWLSWSKGGQNWNTMCSSCHSTHVQKNYDAQEDSFHTTYKEINVACESCHGPGRDHVLAMELGKKDPYAAFVSASHRQKTDNCATCHARRTMLEDSGDPHSTFLNRYFPQTLNNAFYEADGQIMEEDFVYGSFLSSKMHRNHVTCVNCHNPHSGKLKAQGNDLCLQCHDNTYAASTHTHHPETSTGAQCVNCHMDGKMYMGNDYRRDHSFRIPRPDQSVKYGTSNACNSCHKDKNAKWASENVNQWFGTERTYHFSDDLIPGSLQDENAISHLQRLLANDSIPEIAKATALDYVQQNGSQEASAMVLNALKDKSDLVRQKAYSGLIFFPKEHKEKYGIVGIRDPVKSIRIMAFRSVVGVNPKSLDPKMEQIWKGVHSEYLTYLKANADFPTGQIMLGEYYQTIGQPNQAIQAYELALKMDSLQVSPYTNLAILYSGKSESTKVKTIILQAIGKFPENAEFHYFMGLNEGGMQNSEGQISGLKRAYELEPTNPKYGYNYILTLYETKEDKNQKEAIMILSDALKVYPNNQKLLDLYRYMVKK